MNEKLFDFIKKSPTAYHACQTAADILMNNGYTELFEEDVYHEISLETCVGKRISAGSTGPESVKAQILSVQEFLKA